MSESDGLDSLRVTTLVEDSVLYESPCLGQHGVSFLVEGIKNSHLCILACNLRFDLR